MYKSKTQNLCTALFVGITLVATFSCKKPGFEPIVNTSALVSNDEILKERMKDKRPNIILIMADDVGYEIPTCNGGESYYTPTLDGMAANGNFSTPTVRPLPVSTRPGTSCY